MEDLQGIGETERGCVGRWILNKKRELKNRKSKKSGKDKSLNIAVLGHKRIPSREGGIEVVVEELSTRMVREGNQVTCYNRMGHHTAGAEFDTLKRDTYHGIMLKNIFTIDYLGLAAVTSSICASFAAAFGNYDIVHIHAEGTAFMCWLPKIMGKKVVVTVHGLDHQREKWGRFASAYIMMGEKSAVRFADEIIVLSKGLQQYFMRNYGRKTAFIPNGVSRPEIRKADLIREKWRLEKDGYILFLGRIVPEKGVKYLIEAFRKVGTDKKLVIAGGSSDTDVFLEESKRQAKEDGRIIFTGFVQGRTLEELYSNAYIYALPSDLEGMPLSLLEAMSYGNCCLVSDIPECTEVIEDKAVVFQKSNVDDLRGKLQLLCDDEIAVQKYKNSASEFICRKYDWNRTAAQTVAIYKEL